MIERIDKEFLGKDKSLYWYSVNEVVACALSKYDSIKVSMMSMKAGKQKIKFTTMHE